MNLLSNAIKFTPFGGNVNINCKLITSEEEISDKNDQFTKAIRSNQGNKKYLEIQVRDSGIGISD